MARGYLYIGRRGAGLPPPGRGRRDAARRGLRGRGPGRGRGVGGVRPHSSCRFKHIEVTKYVSEYMVWSGCIWVALVVQQPGNVAEPYNAFGDDPGPRVEILTEKRQSFLGGRSRNLQTRARSGPTSTRRATSRCPSAAASSRARASPAAGRRATQPPRSILCTENHECELY